MKKIVFVFLATALLATSCQKSPSADSQLVTPVAPSPAAPASGGVTSPSPQLSQSLAIPEAQTSAPTTKEGWIDLGNREMDGGSYSEAIVAYQKALELDPSNVDVRVDMGTCYRNLGQAEKAIEIYKQALQINPNHAFAWRNSGVVYYYDLHKNAEALAAFKKYLEVSPNAADAAQIKQTIAQISAQK